MYKTLNIPLEASQTAIREGYLHELRVYLALKFQAGDGQIRSSEIDYTQLCELSGFQDQRTIEKHINTLLDLNWIGKDSTWTFIRSFERLRSKLEATSRTAVEIRPQDIPTVHEFLLGAKIGHSARAKRYARKKPGAKPTSKQLNGKTYTPSQISCSLIGEWFGYSPSTASRVKQKAKAIGYLDYTHQSKPLDILQADLSAYMKSMGLDREYIFFHNRKPHVRLTDRFIIGGNDLHQFAFKTRCEL